jgi:RNA polymerase sigma-70 factor (ECF subfamily)
MEEFEQYRSKLWAIAYKMTKSAADAEDIVQDVFLAAGSSGTAIINTENYLVRSAMNRCFSLLEKRKHISYPGPDLPEPIFRERFSKVQQLDVSFALTLLLQQLNPVERAVFILRETLDYGYPEIAGILSLTQDNCRQLLHRARVKVKAGKTTSVTAKDTSPLITAFLQLCAGGNTTELLKVLSEDVKIYSDGGGKISAALNPIHGAAHCIAFLTGIYKKMSGRLSFRTEQINGETGVVFYNKRSGERDTVMVVSFENEQIISRIYLIRNPDKVKPKTT